MEDLTYHSKNGYAHGTIRSCSWLPGDVEIENGYAAVPGIEEVLVGLGLAFPSVCAAIAEIERFSQARPT